MPLCHSRCTGFQEKGPERLRGAVRAVKRPWAGAVGAIDHGPLTFGEPDSLWTHSLLARGRSQD